MLIRKAQIKDVDGLKQLFFDTINAINSRDYNKEQVEVWSSTVNNIKSLIDRIHKQHFYVAYNENGSITGFASIDDSGYLDLMFVHKDFQRMGVASILFEKLKEIARTLKLMEITTEASITAKPFFEKKGFTVIRQQEIFINTVGLTNYKMQLLLAN
ncbi:GNAT family N-acetyltransferase [Solitalea longa]|nr:GNAT family N-acetyltransferase [Solitalea longa]